MIIRYSVLGARSHIILPGLSVIGSTVSVCRKIVFRCPIRPAGRKSFRPIGLTATTEGWAIWLSQPHVPAEGHILHI